MARRLSVAVGTLIAERPRTEPYVRLSRIRLPPRVQTTHRERGGVCGPALVTRQRGAVSGTCFARAAFPLASALGSTNSAADCSAAFAGFTATMASSDFPPPCITGYGSSPSARTAGIAANGQTWDLPVSDALLLHVICSSTRAGRQCLAITAPLMWRSAAKTASAPAIRVFPGSITHPMQPLCTLRGRHCCRLAQHSLPGGSLRPTWAGLPPADRASSLALSFAHPTADRVHRDRAVRRTVAKPGSCCFRSVHPSA